MNQIQAFANNSLFIGDLSKFCTEANLEGLFSSYGQVVDVKIKRNNTTGKTLSYGFVTFINEQCAASAMDQLNGVAFFGRNLRIRWAVHNAKAQKPAEESVINSVYVRFITPRVSEYITEEDFHRVFDPFGCILDVSIKESSIDPRTHRQSGYGFVHFTSDNDGIAAAFKAVSCIDNSTVESVTYNVELSKNLLKQFQEMKRNGTVDGNGLMIPTSGMQPQQLSGYSQQQNFHHQRGSSDGSITAPSTGNNSMRSIPSSAAVGMGMGGDGYPSAISNSPHPAAAAGSHSRWANNSPFPDASAGGAGNTTSRSPYANMPAPTPMRNYGHTQSHQLYPPSQTGGHHQRSGSGGSGGYEAMYGGAYHPSGAYTGGPYGQVYGGAPYPQRHHPGMSGYDPSAGAPYSTGAQAQTQGHGGSYYHQQHQQMTHQQQHQQQYRNTAAAPTGTSAPIGIPGASQSPALSDHTDWPHGSTLSGSLSALAPSFQRGTSGGASHSVGSGKATSPLSSAAASFTSQGILDSSSNLSCGGYIARSQSISPMPSRSPKMHQTDALGGSLAVGSIPLHSSSARSHTGSLVRSLSESLDEDSLYGAVASYPPSQAAYSPMLEHSPYLDGHSRNSSFSSNATFGKPPPLNLQGLQYHNNAHSNGSTTNSVSGGSVYGGSMYGSSASTSPVPTVRGGLTERLQAMKLGTSAWEGDANTSLASLRGGEGGMSSSNKPPTPGSSRVLSAAGATPLSGPLRSQHLSHSFGSSSHSQHSTPTAAVGAGRTVGHNHSNNHLGILGITPSLPPSSLSARSDLHSRSTSNSSVSVHSDINRSGSISPQPFPASSSSASLSAHINVRGIRTGNQSDIDLQGQAQQSSDLNALLAGFNNPTSDYINNSNNSNFTTAATTTAPMRSLYEDVQRTEQAVAASHLLLGRAPLQRQTPLSSEGLEVDQLDMYSKLLESHSNSHSSELAGTSIGAPLGEAYLRARDAKTRQRDDHSGEDAKGLDPLLASTLQCEYVENEDDDQDFMYSPASATSPNKNGSLSASSSSSFWFTSSSSCGGVDATAASLLPGPHSFASFSCEGGLGLADGAFSSSSTSPDKKPTGIPSPTTTLRRCVPVHDQHASSESNTDDQQSQQVVGIALSSEPSSATATTMESDTSLTPPATMATMDSARIAQAPAVALSEEAVPKKSRQLSLMQFFKLSSTSGSSSSNNPAVNTSTTAARGTASSNEAK